jgi:large subunit ribosomal protein L15
MPLQRRIPKRGFKSLNRVEYQGVNVRDLSRIGAGEVTPEILKEYGLIGTLKKRVKILGTGGIDGAYQISAHAFSGSARTKIEGAGGTVTILGKSSAAGPLAQAVVETVTENEEAPTPEGDEVSEADDEKA